LPSLACTAWTWDEVVFVNGEWSMRKHVPEKVWFEACNSGSSIDDLTPDPTWGCERSIWVIVLEGLCGREDTQGVGKGRTQTQHENGVSHSIPSHWWIINFPMFPMAIRKWRCEGGFLKSGYSQIIHVTSFSGWWFGTWILCFHSVGNVIIPTEFHIFQRDRSTSNQFYLDFP
jgi:hypothetical protein